jgi:hypothetical protein
MYITATRGIPNSINKLFMRKIEKINNLKRIYHYTPIHSAFPLPLEEHTCWGWGGGRE